VVTCAFPEVFRVRVVVPERARSDFVQPAAASITLRHASYFDRQRGGGIALL
jgi:hypothetical protein